MQRLEGLVVYSLRTSGQVSWNTTEFEILAKTDRVLWSAVAFYIVRRLDHLCHGAQSCQLRALSTERQQ
jgi:hypothetical protein